MANFVRCIKTITYATAGIFIGAAKFLFPNVMSSCDNDDHGRQNDGEKIADDLKRIGNDMYKALDEYESRHDL